MKNKGITLIALIVTIVILLILASTTVNLTIGNNGIINKAKEAKIAMEIAQERGNVNMAAEAAYMYWPYVGIKEERFINELDKIIGKGKYTLSYDNENKIYTVTYTESKRSYNVNNTEGEENKGNGILAINTKITKFVQNLGSAQVCYKIQAISEGKEVYNDIENISCDEAGEKKIIINDIPVGSKVTITAIYNTQSYQLQSNEEITTTIKKGETTNADFLYEYSYKNIASDTATVSLNYNGIKMTLNN